MTKPTIEDLEREVEEKRLEYLGMLDSLKGAIGTIGFSRAGMGDQVLNLLVTIDENRLMVERPRLAYEEALGRLQRAQADQAQARMEGMQRSMTVATWVIAFFTIIIGIIGFCAWVKPGH